VPDLQAEGVLLQERDLPVVHLRVTAEDIHLMTRSGWLAQQPAPFRDEVLKRALVETFAAGQAVYRLGDPLDGIYGLAAGILAVTTAPGPALPRLVHIGTPGFWTGEGPFMIGEPQRITLRAGGAEPAPAPAARRDGGDGRPRPARRPKFRVARGYRWVSLRDLAALRAFVAAEDEG
jgi:hypothetical protein